MFRNFFKTTFRNLWKNKTYSFLNIFGLAVGIACAALIFLWIEDEVNYDSAHVKKDRLYLVMNNWPFAGEIRTIPSTPGLLGPAIKKEIPGIANTCRISDGVWPLLGTGNVKAYSAGMYAETSVFSMFTLPFVQGSAQHAFDQLYSMVITESAAKKYFGGTASAMGKTLRLDNRQDYVVTGVLKDLPDNSTMQFEFLAPFAVFAKERPQGVYNWGNMSSELYVEVSPSANVAAINAQLYNFVNRKSTEHEPTHAFLYSMSKWRLYNTFENGKPTGGGRIEYVRMLSIIAWVILIIACINFMNLATARSEKKAKEVGVRKVLGAGKQGLIAQFIGEALLMSLLAAVTATIIVLMALPAFNMLVQKNLSLSSNLTVHLSALLVIAVVCGLIAGSYPSLYLSSFNPIAVLKGLKIKTGGATFIRKSLVVLQFTVSIVFIICTIVIYQQIQHVKSRDLGFNKNNLVEVDAQVDIIAKFTLIKQSLLHSGLVVDVALADHTIIYGGNNSDGVKWQGKPADEKVLVSQRTISPNFFTTTGMQLIAGRGFGQHVMADSQNVVINEALAKLLGKGSPMGKIIDASNWDRPALHVVGVVKDYVYGDMYSKPDPVIFFSGYGPNGGMNTLYVRPKTGADNTKALAAIEDVMKKANPEYPFEYRFVDDQFNEMFKDEVLMSRLANVFAVLAIIISCLGLFGLAAYTAERRIKEIGIRKVLGASVTGLASLLSQDFIKLVGISSLISFPLAGWMMHNWLQKYTYRIDISWWIFLLAGVIAVAIAIATISFQTVKAALMNPVKSLRSE